MENPAKIVANKRQIKKRDVRAVSRVCVGGESLEIKRIYTYTRLFLFSSTAFCFLVLFFH